MPEAHNPGIGGIGMSEAAKKPNFIIIYCDDLGYGDLGCFGSPDIKTPHLDELARNGVRFTNWYSNCPVCSPSRASLLTGRYPRRAGVTNILGGKRGTPGLPPGEITLAKALKPLGYRTALLGKWHLGVSKESWPNAHGFDEFFGFLAGCVDYYSHIFYWGQGGGVNPVHDLWQNEKEVWENGRYLTEVITEKAVEFIGRKSDAPFLLYLPYNAPHYPMHAPKKYLDRYPNLPPDKRIMAAMISAVDDGVGEIVRALKKSGRYEDTVIFFSSDNGPSTESRNWLDGTEDRYYGGSAGIFRGHKGSLFDGGIHMPAILSWPQRIPSGRVCEKVGAMMDIFPTLLEIAGGALPKDRVIDGTSVLPMLAGTVGNARRSVPFPANGTVPMLIGGSPSPVGNGRRAVPSAANGTVPMVMGGSPSPHSDLFWEHGDQLAIRRGKWKLVLNGKLDFSQDAVDQVHLADLESDPGERANLADREPALVAELTNVVTSWAASLGNG